MYLYLPCINRSFIKQWRRQRLNVHQLSKYSTSVTCPSCLQIQMEEGSRERLLPDVSVGAGLYEESVDQREIS